MRHRLLLRRAMPLPPPPPPAPRSPGVAGGRLFSSLPPPPPLQSRRLDTDCKVDPRSFEFKKNKFGKPEILWQSDDSRMEWPLHFNISHTSSLIACGITMDTPIGIDIEEKTRKPAKNILSLARRYFTPSEVDYLAKIPDPDAQHKEFIKLWTLKVSFPLEAYVKALGRGFSGAPFNKFSIVLVAKNGIRISVIPGTAGYL
nr:unnamed protein product [Digitaria exilis]